MEFDIKKEQAVCLDMDSTEKKGRALIAMSGGVDSSVSAKLMIDSGYECVGCTMKLYDRLEAQEDITASKTCCSADDTEDARSVAYRLGMPFYVFNFKDEFKEKVIDNFVDSYLQGRTPNPCIECNRHLKFDKLFERAEILGCDHVVTGHYARIEYIDGRYVLKKGPDPNKDQSYVLFRMTQYQLAHTFFPLGNMSKPEVRAIAEANGFVNAAKPDSQDICFVPDGDYASVIRQYTGQDIPEGNFVDMSGKVRGKHKGIIHYTIGQRRGLGIAAEAPLYVVGIDVKNNRVLLGSNDDLFSRNVSVTDFNWIPGGETPDNYRCSAKIRYHHTEQPGTLYSKDGNISFVFDEPQRAVTPGQSLVLYRDDEVLGGGTII